MNNDLMKAMNEELEDAIKSGNTEQFVKKLSENVDKSVKDLVNEKVLDKYEELKNVTDETVLAQRGIKALTSEEKKFYDKMISANDALTNFEVALPITIESKVFENMVVEHPLLNAIDFVNSKGLTEWILSKDLDYAAAWGDLNDAVSQEAKASFVKVEFGQFKLSAWMPVPKTMLDLGMTWLDQYVTTYLGEIIARKLEDAIVNGTGQKMPVGMIKTVDIENQTTPATDKVAEKITDLNTTTIGAIAAKLTDDGKRQVGTIDMIVNPVDYWTHVYPALYYTNVDGQVVKSNLPLNVYSSLAVPKGKAVFGICKNYFATAGFGVTNGKIEYSDHYKFLEDQRVYKARLVAYGTPKDNVSFYVYDITELQEAAIVTRTRTNAATQSASKSSKVAEG